MARSGYNDYIELEDEDVPVTLDGRQLTWRETDSAYLAAYKEGQKASNIIRNAGSAPISTKNYTNAVTTLNTCVERLHSLFNQSVKALPEVLEDLPELGEKMVSDMVKWKSPTDQAKDFRRIWDAVTPMLDSVREQSSYFAEAILYRLCESDPSHDPRSKQSTRHVPQNFKIVG